MMKTALFAALLLSFINVCCLHAQSNVTTKEGPFIENDTLFLLKKMYNDAGYKYTQSIYIEKNRKSATYQRLLDFQLDPHELNASKEVYRKRHEEPIKKHDVYNLPRHWIPLYSYEGFYHLYFPSEGGLKERHYLDSCYVAFEQFEPIVYAIHSTKKIAPNIYHMKIEYMLDTRSKQTDLYIYMIDAEHLTAVWQFKQSDGKSWYKLMIAEESARLYPMIVWNSPYHKEFYELRDVNFDSIDFEKLIKNLK